MCCALINIALHARSLCIHRIGKVFSNMSLLASAQTNMILAQSDIDSKGLSGLIAESGDAIKTWGSAIIGIVALIFVTISLVKAITAFSNKNMSDGVKEVIKIAIIIILAIMGVGGLFALVNSVNPVNHDGGVTDYLS